jgi:hypothetical protein
VRQKRGAVILRDGRGERASNANKVSDHVNWKDGSSAAGQSRDPAIHAERCSLARLHRSRCAIGNRHGWMNAEIAAVGNMPAKRLLAHRPVYSTLNCASALSVCMCPLVMHSSSVRACPSQIPMHSCDHAPCANWEGHAKAQGTHTLERNAA